MPGANWRRWQDAAAERASARQLQGGVCVESPRIPASHFPIRSPPPLWYAALPDEDRKQGRSISVRYEHGDDSPFKRSRPSPAGRVRLACQLRTRQQLAFSICHHVACPSRGTDRPPHKPSPRGLHSYQAEGAHSLLAYLPARTAKLNRWQRRVNAAFPLEMSYTAQDAFTFVPDGDGATFADGDVDGDHDDGGDGEEMTGLWQRERLRALWGLAGIGITSKATHSAEYRAINLEAVPGTPQHAAGESVRAILHTSCVSGALQLTASLPCFPPIQIWRWCLPRRSPTSPSSPPTTRPSPRFTDATTTANLLYAFFTLLTPI